MLNPETEEISCKMVSDDAEKPAYRIFSGQNYLSRINLPAIREEARRIALDIREDSDTVYSVSVPNDAIRVARGDRVISNRISFDAKDEVLSSMESVTVTADGSRITMTVTPRYEKKDGVPVKIGQTTVVRHDIPRAVSGPIEGEIYHSPDDIPTLNGAEYEELVKKGLLFEKAGMVFGDPGDLSYTETVVEIYNDIRVNETPDIAFRSFWQFVKDVAAAIVKPIVTIVNEVISWFNSGSNIGSSLATPPEPAGHQGYEQPAPLPPAETVDGKVLSARVQDRTEADTSFYFFNGFDFANYKASGTGLSTIITEEYRAISQGGTYTNKDDENKDDENKDDKKKYKVTKSQAPYVIVGHSEGGLRALGYATYVEENAPAEFSKLRGVVTISGANRGFKALEGGIPVFRSKLYNMADTLGNGLKALNVTVLDDVLFPSTERFVDDVYKNKALNWLISLIPGPLNNYVLPVLVNQNPDEIAEIRDLVPFSAFANTYVADAKVEVVKVVTGRQAVLVMDPWPYITLQETYKYYTKYSDEHIKFSETLPVAYIIGTQNNTLSMSEDEKAVRGWLKAFEILFAAAEGVNVVYALENPVTTLLRTANAIDADKARQLLANFDNALADLIGSPKSDGLLAEESQFYTQGNVVGQRRFEYSHNEIEKSDKDAVWNQVADYIRNMPE